LIRKSWPPLTIHPSIPLSLAGLFAAGFALHAQNSLLPAAPTPILEEQTNHTRFQDYLTVVLGPRALFIPTFSATRHMLDPPSDYPRQWRDGPGAFGRNYGNALASRSSRETGRYLTGALLHEDFRYRPSTSTNLCARAWHAVAFTFVDKSDSGRNQLAYSNFVGAGAGGFAGTLYLPAGYNNLSHAETRTATAFAGFAVQNLWLEFAPEALRLKQKLHIPLSAAPVPKWWTKRD
jgi:hypothetical protein